MNEEASITESPPPFTIPQLLEHAEQLESEKKVRALRVPCDVPGCRSRITERGKKRHMTQSHPDVKEKGKPKKRGRPPGSKSKPKPGYEKVKLVELMWSNSGSELQLHPDGSIWIAKKLILEF